MIRKIVSAAAVLLAVSLPANADPQQDFIVNKLNEHYNGARLRAGDDAEKQAQLAEIRKRAIKAVHSKPGLGGRSQAEAAVAEMNAVVQ